jgi:hypothetical protein
MHGEAGPDIPVEAGADLVARHVARVRRDARGRLPEALPPLDGRRLPLWRDGEIVVVAADEIGSITLIDDA